MKSTIMIVAAMFMATGAVAQVEASRSHNPAVKDSKVHSVTTPAMGHSSFTEGQAKGRIEKAGYTNVTGLKKLDSGAWQGTAMKDSKTTTVTLDYKGDITSR